MTCINLLWRARRGAVSFLAALAVAVSPAVIPNSYTSPVAVADELTDVSEVALGATQSFIATFTDAAAGATVQFYLDGVPQGARIAVDAATGAATKEITAASSGSHTVTARLFDANGENPLDTDVTDDFSTPNPALTPRSTGSPADSATYSGTVDGTASSLADPVEVAADATVTLDGSMTSDFFQKVYEVGINIPTSLALAGDAGTATLVRLKSGSRAPTTPDSTVAWKDGAYQGTGTDAAWPAELGLTATYVGRQLDSSTSYGETYMPQVKVRATTPGLYVPEFVVFKGEPGLKVVTPVEAMAFRVLPKPLPALIPVGSTPTTSE